VRVALNRGGAKRREGMRGDRRKEVGKEGEGTLKG